MDDVLIKITAYNRGPQDAPLQIIPQFWFRNDWSWFPQGEVQIPSIKKTGERVMEAQHESLGPRWIHFGKNSGTSDGVPELMFTNNESNLEKLYQDKNHSPYVKDGFHEYVIRGNHEAINQKDFQGTKAAGLYKFDKVLAGGSVEIRIRFNRSQESSTKEEALTSDFEDIFQKRSQDNEEFYGKLMIHNLPDDLRCVQRQALAGMLWSKQWYHFDQRSWRKGDPEGMPPPPERYNLRNKGWKHLYAEDILSMPDKWEYPFFAAWDMAFHTIPLSIVDPTFAKKQLDLLTREWYMHPSGQIPAYEWNFSDVNPRK